MAHSTGLLERYVAVVSADLKRWPQLPPFSQSMPAEYPPRDLVVALFFSIVIHVLLALLLWKVTNDRIPVDPVFPSIDAPMIVSLTTLPSDSDDLYRKSETETIVTVKKSEVPVSKISKGTPPATDAVPSINLDAFYSMEWNFGNIPEFKVESIETSVGQGVHVSDTPGSNTLSSYLTPSHGLDALYRFEQAFGEMAESELQNKRLKWRIDYIKKYQALMPPDCRTAYAQKGLLAIPYFIRDAITDSDKACIW